MRILFIIRRNLTTDINLQNEWNYLIIEYNCKVFPDLPSSQQLSQPRYKTHLPPLLCTRRPLLLLRRFCSPTKTANQRAKARHPSCKLQGQCKVAQMCVRPLWRPLSNLLLQRPPPQTRFRPLRARGKFFWPQVKTEDRGWSGSTRGHYRDQTVISTECSKNIACLSQYWLFNIVQYFLFTLKIQM